MEKYSVLVDDLFEQLERLGDETLSSEELKKRIKEASVVTKNKGKEIKELSKKYYK